MTSDLACMRTSSHVGWRSVWLRSKLDLVDKRELEVAEAEAFVARYVSILVRRALATRGGPDEIRIRRIRDLANVVVQAIREHAPDALGRDEEIDEATELLLAIMERPRDPRPPRPPVRPDTPLDLECAARQRHRPAARRSRGHQGVGQCRVRRPYLRRSSSGMACESCEAPSKRFSREVGGFVSSRRRTSERTDRRAIDELVRMGADVRVSYDTRMTRLHAKAWLFNRGHLSTAYIGSSNLSKSALVDGLEWNVRISRSEQPHLIDTFAATFDGLLERPLVRGVRPRA